MVEGLRNCRQDLKPHIDVGQIHLDNGINVNNLDMRLIAWRIVPSIWLDVGVPDLYLYTIKLYMGVSVELYRYHSTPQFIRTSRIFDTMMEYQQQLFIMELQGLASCMAMP